MSVGDATHGNALCGFSTGLALVGACVLAGEFHRAGGNHTIAFPACEERSERYAAVSQQVNAGRLLTPGSVLRIRGRNLLSSTVARVRRLMTLIDQPARSRLARSLDDVDAAGPDLMARVGWVAAQQESAPDGPTWLRLSVFDDGWVEIPTLGRVLSATRANLTSALRTVGALVVGFVLVWVLLRAAASIGGALGTVVTVAAVVLLFALLVTTTIAVQRSRYRQAARWAADGADLRARKKAGTLPRVPPGASKWRRAHSAADFSARLTNTTLIAATDVSVVTVHPPGVAADGSAEHVVEVLLHSGVRRCYRSPDATLDTLLTRFGVAAG